MTTKCHPDLMLTVLSSTCVCDLGPEVHVALPQILHFRPLSQWAWGFSSRVEVISPRLLPLSPPTPVPQLLYSSVPCSFCRGSFSVKGNLTPRRGPMEFPFITAKEEKRHFSVLGLNSPVSSAPVQSPVLTCNLLLTLPFPFWLIFLP